MFYDERSDVPVARVFPLERLQHNQSVVFFALWKTGSAVGFTQLYPGFSSVSMARSFTLNDLYVVSGARRSKVGAKLLEAAAAYSRAEGAVRLSLSTAMDNEAAQALYASEGWVRDTKFCVYSLPLLPQQGVGRRTR